MVDFGYTMMCEQAGLKQLVQDVRQAEDAGFDFAVISDHYSPWLASQGHAPYVWSVLGAASTGSRWSKWAANNRRSSSTGLRKSCGRRCAKAERARHSMCSPMSSPASESSSSISSVSNASRAVVSSTGSRAACCSVSAWASSSCLLIAQMYPIAVGRCLARSPRRMCGTHCARAQLHAQVDRGRVERMTVCRLSRQLRVQAVQFGTVYAAHSLWCPRSSRCRPNS